MENVDSLRKHFLTHPPDGLLEPPKLPPRPDLFDEIQWRPHVNSRDARMARTLWDLPNARLRASLDRVAHPFPRPETRDEEAVKDTHVLAREVYDHLLLEHMVPLTEADWKQKWADIGLHEATWTAQDLLRAWGRDAQADSRVIIDNEDVMTSPYWTVVRLRQALRGRGLADTGRRAELQQRLCDHEREQYVLLPQSNLSHLGIDKKTGYPFQLKPDDEVKPLDMYTWAIKLSPYNPTYWVSRAYCHYQQAFFDLAIGDAYRAQLLCEVLVDARARNRQPGLYTRIWHAITEHILAGISSVRPTLPEEVLKMRQPNGVNYFVPTLRKALHNIISLSLAAMRARKDYKLMEGYLTERVIMPARDIKPFERRSKALKYHLKPTPAETKEERRKWFHENRAGSVPGKRQYPYDLREKERDNVDFVTKLNQKMFEENKSMPWKKCKVDRLPGNTKSLGIFATKSIKKHELIYAEEPSMRGHIQDRRPGTNDLDPDLPAIERCDNCGKELNWTVSKGYEDPDRAVQIKYGRDEAACKCCLQEEDRLYYCAVDEEYPENKTCCRIARELYHHKACGKNWLWLMNAMRPCLMKWGPSFNCFSHTNEEHGTVLSLLLRDVFDITLTRRVRKNDPELMAHEIDELVMLEDSKDWQDPQAAFPFTFAANIQVPFDILMQLGVDIFSDLTFDTWVIQTVLKKLMVNVVPWGDMMDDANAGEDASRKKNKIVDSKVIRSPRRQLSMAKYHRHFQAMNMSFRVLYLFPGFSLFNHACPPSHNAEWGYDYKNNAIRNRVLVWATKDIAEGEEICIPYTRKKFFSTKRMRRELGRRCTCPECGNIPSDVSSADDSDYQSESDHNEDYLTADEGDDGDHGSNGNNGGGGDGRGGKRLPEDDNNRRSESPQPGDRHMARKTGQVRPGIAEVPVVVPNKPPYETLATANNIHPGPETNVANKQPPPTTAIDPGPGTNTANKQPPLTDAVDPSLYVHMADKQPPPANALDPALRMTMPTTQPPQAEDGFPKLPYLKDMVSQVQPRRRRRLAIDMIEEEEVEAKKPRYSGSA